HRDSLFSPRSEFIGLVSGLPFMETVAIVVEDAAPVSLGRVPGAGETKQVSRMPAAAEQAGQLRMNPTAPFPVTPARHDQGAGENPCTLLASPTDRCQELIGAVRLPISKKQLSVWRQRV